MLVAYHFVGKTLRDGRSVPPIGEWLEHDGPLELCKSGLHASVHPFDGLKYAPGANLCRVECGGEIIHGDDKLVASRRRIIAQIDATEMLREFARWCALQVIHLWDAPQVVKDYLTTGDESLLVAAWEAVRDATEVGARDVVLAAVRAAAWATVRYAARDATDVAAREAAWDAACASARTDAGDAARKVAEAAALAAQRTKFAEMVDEALASGSIK